MDNSSYRCQYIQSLTEKDGLQEESVRVVERFWNRVETAEQEIGRSLEDGYTREEYLSLIDKLNVSSVNVFLVSKCRVGKYLKWLESQGLLNKEHVDLLYGIEYEELRQDRIFETRYFRDFGTLQESIKTTLWAAERVDDAVFAMQISLIYMAWCGVPINEALAIKKDDISDDCIVVGERVIRPNTAIMEYVKEYRDAESYESQGRRILTLKYVPSEYLFRSARAERIDSVRAILALVRFGKSGGEKKNPYLYEKIYWSGIFNRSYLYELEHGEIRNGDVGTMEKLFQEKYSGAGLANRRLKEYQNFRNYFFPSPQR